MFLERLNRSFSIVVCVNDLNIYNNNIISSPLIKNNSYEIIPKYFPSSASIAYNEGVDSAKNDIVVLAHQDVIFPINWDQYLFDAIDQLEVIDKDWAVLGVCGVKENGEGIGYLYCNGNGKILGKSFRIPTEIQTLDEVVLILKKSSGIRFDNKLPFFHFYGTDICLTAKYYGRKSYVISAFILHNSKSYNKMPKEFYICCDYIYEKWKYLLPIHTNCLTIYNNKYMFLLKNKYIYNLKVFIRKYYDKNWKFNKRNDTPLLLLDNILKTK
jgi:hypothetical protein